MAELDAETIAKLKDKHGKIEKIVACEQVVVCRVPTQDEWAAYAAAEESGSKYAALSRLFKDVCVWPSTDEVVAMIKAMPAISAVMGAEVREMAGITNKAVREKL